MPIGVKETSHATGDGQGGVLYPVATPGGLVFNTPRTHASALGTLPPPLQVQASMVASIDCFSTKSRGRLGLPQINTPHRVCWQRKSAPTTQL